jgi:hypothetical protein
MGSAEGRSPFGGGLGVSPRFNFFFVWGGERGESLFQHHLVFVIKKL